MPTTANNLPRCALVNLVELTKPEGTAAVGFGLHCQLAAYVFWFATA